MKAVSLALGVFRRFGTRCLRAVLLQEVRPVCKFSPLLGASHSIQRDEHHENEGRHSGVG